MVKRKLLPVKGLRKLETEVIRFVREHGISCSETIYQSDPVILDATEFIDNLVQIVGFEPYEEES